MALGRGVHVVAQVDRHRGYAALPVSDMFDPRVREECPMTRCRVDAATP